MRHLSSALLAVGLVLCLSAGVSRACNEVVCASIVSKCMLTQACKCDLTRHPGNNCTCCHDCAKCLGYLYLECCSCLGMCEPRPRGSVRESQVGDMSGPSPNLFAALTSVKEPQLLWTSMTFPIDVDRSVIEDTLMDWNKYIIVNPLQDTAPAEQSKQVTVNCTVLYMSQCMSGRKCRAYCESTGAAAYRYFFDGCCECVGFLCINYGINESRCLDCPPVDEEEFDDELTDRILSGTSSPPVDEAALQSDILFEEGTVN